MKKRRHTRAWPPAAGLPSQEEIDRLYGLEPIFEPAAAHLSTQELVTVGCPYCGEPLHTRVDLTAGESTYVEDCQVCCRPIELTIERTLGGALSAVTAHRTD
jgi:hypothetical protein